MKAPFKFLEKANVRLDKNKLALKNRLTQTVVTTLRYVFLIGMSFVMVYPVLFILSEAFKGPQDVYDSTVNWLPKHFSNLSMEIGLHILDFSASLMNTIIVVLPSVLLQLVSSLLAGYGFARFKFRGKSILFAILIFTIIVPVQTYMIPLYSGFANFDFFGIGSLIGLFTGGETLYINLFGLELVIEPTVNLLQNNSPIPFYLMAGLGAGIRSGLYIFMLRQFFVGMPRELDEAASIDGCGPFAVFVKVMLPNAIPMMVTILVFSMVWYWNDYYLSGMFFDQSTPLSLRLAIESENVGYLVHKATLPEKWKSDYEILKKGVLAAGCLVTIAPPLFLYIFAQRYFTEGLERSGIVG